MEPQTYDAISFDFEFFYISNYLFIETLVFIPHSSCSTLYYDSLISSSLFTHQSVVYFYFWYDHPGAHVHSILALLFAYSCDLLLVDCFRLEVRMCQEMQAITMRVGRNSTCHPTVFPSST